jgi:hypothetical protein
MLMRNSAVSMARDSSNANLRMSGREILGMMYDDLKNTGYKLRPNNFEADINVSYYSPPNKDSSSFISYNKVGGNSRYDSLKVRIGRLSADGVTLKGIDTIVYKVKENRDLVRRIRGTSATSWREVTLAKNVEALKFRYSDDLSTWYDDFTTSPADLDKKKNVQYIKAIIVLKDNKKLAAVKNQTIVLVPGDSLKPTDQSLYERHETTIPIPNNGLFP